MSLRLLLPLARPWQGEATCLGYHTINSRPASEFWPNYGIAVSPDRFAAQMHYVHKHLTAVDFRQALTIVETGIRPDKPAVTVTFDDGYKSVLTEALPLLEKFEIPCTIFLNPGVFDNSARLWWDELAHYISVLDSAVLEDGGKPVSTKTSGEKSVVWESLRRRAFRLHPTQLTGLLDALASQTPVKFNYRDQMLSTEDVRKLSQHPLVTIGSHTISHPTLSTLTAGELRYELEDSKARLEQLVQKEVRYLAYPIGGRFEADEREFTAAKASGYSAAVSTRIGHWHTEHIDALHALPRIPVVYEDTIDLFRWKTSGLQAMIRNEGRRVITR